MKNVLKSIMFGIAWGCTINCIICLVVALVQGEIAFTAMECLKQFVCSVIVGVGFAVPALIYKNERLPQAIKCIIHLGIGFAVYLPTAYAANWIPTEMGIGALISVLVIMLIGSIVIYFFFWLYYKREVKKINEKIKEKTI